MSQRLVADASVLIFLGKIRQLGLVERLWRGPFYISRLVKNEIFPPGLTTEERDYLIQGLRRFKSRSPRIPLTPEGPLSRADWSIVNLAQEVRADIVLADEKALRNVMTGLGFKVLGTLGCLLLAAEKELVSRHAAREGVMALVRRHRFHISAESFQAFLKALD